MERKRGAVIFDGDDTLWETEPLYDAARNQARTVVEASGLDGAGWERLQKEIDEENFGLLGLAVGRFPLSCAQAYERIAERAHGHYDPATRRAVVEAAESVFVSLAVVSSDAEAVLEELRPDWTLILCTRGDSKVQERRLAASGLGIYFDQVSVVPHKDESTFLDLLDAAEAGPSESWSVGNSVRSDIVPALAAGMGAIWVPADVWAVEQSEPPEPSERFFTVPSLGRVPETIRGC